MAIWLTTKFLLKFKDLELRYQFIYDLIKNVGSIFIKCVSRWRGLVVQLFYSSKACGEMKFYFYIFFFGACSKQVSYLGKLWSIKTSCHCNIYRFQIAACLSSFALIKVCVSLSIYDARKISFLYYLREVIPIFNIKIHYTIILEWFIWCVILFSKYFIG